MWFRPLGTRPAQGHSRPLVWVARSRRPRGGLAPATTLRSEVLPSSGFSWNQDGWLGYHSLRLAVWKPQLGSTPYHKERFKMNAPAMGLIPCHTPRRSPQTNGLAEAFFGSFKRDYVYQACLETVEDVARQLLG